MKNSKIIIFSILLVGIYLTSCKKDADQQLQQGTPAGNKEKLFEKSLIIYNADKTNSTTLRFRAASKELLDKMPLENTEFTLVETPDSATEATGVAAATIPSDEGSSGYSNKDASMLQSTNEKQVFPEDAIQVDLPFAPKTKPISIQVKSKSLNSEQAVAAPCNLGRLIIYHPGRFHHIKVTNLNICPILVYFYHKDLLGNWIFSGFSYNLSKSWSAWYFNPTWVVGANVYSCTTSYNYNVIWW